MAPFIVPHVPNPRAASAVPNPRAAPAVPNPRAASAVPNPRAAPAVEFVETAAIAAMNAAGAAADAAAAAAVAKFHRQLPCYAVTPLRSLPTLAAELGVGQLYYKDESDRFGMPSYKILGASWAVHCALAKAVGLRRTVSLAQLMDAVRAWNADTESIAKGEKKQLRIVSATMGNWGRAVARMAWYIGQLPCKLFVPAFMPPDTQAILRSEGAEVQPLKGMNYDHCVAHAQAEAQREGSLLILDVGFVGNEDVPRWAVEGYYTMLLEADAQLLQATGGQVATHVVVPVGTGTTAQAVVQHYKGKSPHHYKKLKTVFTKSTVPPRDNIDEGLWYTHDGKHGPAEKHTIILAVEPDTAACLRASLAVGRRVTVPTVESVLCGLNCPTLSQMAWPVLWRGIDYGIAVSDRNSHVAVHDLLQGTSGFPYNEIPMKSGNMADAANRFTSVAAGPCGAATLAGLRKVCRDWRRELKLDRDSIVVLLGTEGPRPYKVPRH